MGIAIDKVRVQTHHLQQFLHPLSLLLALGDVVDFQWFTDNAAHGHAGVERGIRVLEDHLHVPAHVPQFLALHFRQFFVLKLHSPAVGR